jgi:hypothetical protein
MDAHEKKAHWTNEEPMREREIKSPSKTHYAHGPPHMPHAQIVVKRLRSVQVAGADTGEGNLDEKCLMSVSYDGASNQRSGINGLSRIV